MSRPDPSVNLTAERSAIASVMLDIWRLDDVALVVKPEHFYSDVHGQVFRTLLAMREAGTPIDTITLISELDKQRLYEQLTGGTTGLIDDLMESVPHGGFAVEHAKLVFECWRRRTAMTAAAAMTETLRDPGVNLDDALGDCDAALRTAQEAGQVSQQMAIGDVLVEICGAARHKMGLDTGFPQFDEMLSGLHGGQLVVLAARPGVGKSAFVANIAQNLVARNDGVLFVSLEMSRADLIYRLVARLSGLRLWQIRSDEIEYKQPIMKAMNSMMKWPLFIDDAVPQTVSQIAAKARILMRRKQIKLIVVDYLQLLSPSADTRRAPREQQVAAMSRDLKCLAKQLNLPIIALSQLNRVVEARMTNRPRLSDLRESGAIEQDADVVAFIHRPSMADATKEVTTATVIIEKQRQGPTGEIAMKWDGTLFLFEEVPKKEESF